MPRSTTQRLTAWVHVWLRGVRDEQGGFCELQGSEGVQRFCIIRVAWGEDRLPQVRSPPNLPPPPTHPSY
jgi:hypothetical protein